MRILLTGATGTLGGPLLLALAERGHQVLACARAPQRLTSAFAPWRGVRVVEADLGRLQRPEQWHPLLAGVEVVINAAGLFVQQHPDDFERIHHRGPAALFQAAVDCGVRRVIQVSALGAQAEAPSAFLRSKQAADALLLSLPLEGCVVKPSLVFTSEGASSRLFCALATLPWLPLPDAGQARVQPIHQTDLLQALLTLVERPERPPQELALVGAEPLSLADYLATLGERMGCGRPRITRVSTRLLLRTTPLMARLPGGLLSADSLRMLAQGSVADVAPLAHLLGRTPRAPSQFIAPLQAGTLRAAAGRYWVMPLARLSLALLWLITAGLSLWPGNREQGLDLLAQGGLPTAWQPPLLYAAALLDAALGLATLLRPSRGLWWAQLGLVGFYTLFIALLLPVQLLHPFAPVVKNLPILALITLLLVQQTEQ